MHAIFKVGIGIQKGGVAVLCNVPPIDGLSAHLTMLRALAWLNVYLAQ
jgi:hypothetical protein